jgi:hypothetical protein
MATQAEIEAAAETLHLHLIGGRTLDDCRVYARAALEAAERVRAEALPAKQDDAERARRYRARKRDGRDATPVTAVTESVTGVTAAAPDVTAVTRNVAPIDKIESEGAPILSSPDLLARLTDAADGNVAPAAVDVAPIQVLLAHGCDLELDVLPAVRALATAATSIKRWDHPPLIRAILRGRDVRITPKGPPPSPPARQHSPGVPRFDMDELVAGYRAGNVDWDTNRLGPPPGAPGCRVDASILRENGYD